MADFGFLELAAAAAAIAALLTLLVVLFRRAGGVSTQDLLGFQQVLATQVNDLSTRLEQAFQQLDNRSAASAAKIDADIRRMSEEAQRNRDGLRATIEAKLDHATQQQSAAATDFRDQITLRFSELGAHSANALDVTRKHQAERLDQLTASLVTLTEVNKQGHEALRDTVEKRLDAIRVENTAKLDEMRRTVDEKLQSTLETRLGESFTRVVEQLERVHKGIGEMQTLASGVGDLRKVLSNVRARGAFGEVQLESLLDQFLSPEQYIRNAQMRDDSLDRVEFAIRFPGKDGTEFLLPVDAKFPHDDYERLLAASEGIDPDGFAAATKALEASVKNSARTIREKYINPPRTLDFGVLFLPTEGLYAEVLRRPGLLEFIQSEYRVTLTGPTTFTAYLIALQMGFKTVAIEKRSGEVWQLLGAVGREFEKHNEVVNKIAKQLSRAAKTVDELGRRGRAMKRQLRDVEKPAEVAAEELLGFTNLPESDDLDEALDLPETAAPSDTALPDHLR